MAALTKSVRLSPVIPDAIRADFSAGLRTATVPTSRFSCGMVCLCVRTAMQLMSVEVNGKMKIIGKKLDALLVARGMTAADLVRALKVRGLEITNQTVSQWRKSGGIEKPNAAKLAAEFGVKLEDISTDSVDDSTQCQRVIRWRGGCLALASIAIYAAGLVGPLCVFGSFTPGGHYHSVVQMPDVFTNLSFSRLDPAMMVGVILSAAIAFAWAKRSGKLALAAALVAALCVVELVFLNRRSVIAAAGVTAVLLLAGRFSLALAIPALFLPYFWGPVADLAIHLFHYERVAWVMVRTDDADIVSGNTRETIWEVATAAFGQPEASGAYWFNHADLFNFYGEVGLTNAHNMPLHAFCERGLVGWVAAIATIGVTVWLGITGWQRIRSSCERMAAYSVCVFLVILGGTEATWKNPSLGILLSFTFLGLLAGASTRKPSPRSRERGAD